MLVSIKTLRRLLPMLTGPGTAPVGNSLGQRPSLQHGRPKSQQVDPTLRYGRHPVAESIRSATPSNPFGFDNAMQRHHAPAIRTFEQNSLPYFDVDPPFIKEESADSDESDETFVVRPRRAKRQPHRRQQPTSPVDSLDPAPQDALLDGTLKLKGQYWEGMGLFDSATLDNKRKRNQKKSPEVLRELEETSQIIEPTEMLFDTEGVLRKRREIRGVPNSDDSLIEGESEPDADMARPPPPKRTRGPGRSALSKRSVNKPRNPHPRNRRRFRAQETYAFTPSEGTDPYAFDMDSDDVKDVMTYGRSSKGAKPRSGLSIHRDNSGPEITFQQPATMSYLSSGFRESIPTAMQQGTQPSQQPPQSNGVPRTHQRQPSWTGNTAFRASNSNGGMQPNGFTPFGQYLNSNLPQPTGYDSIATGFQHQLGMGLAATNPLYQPQLGAHQHQLGANQPQLGANYDFLGLTNESHELALFGYGDGDHNFQNAGNDVIDARWYFPPAPGGLKEDDQATLLNAKQWSGPEEDDQATISAPNSDQ